MMSVNLFDFYFIENYRCWGSLSLEWSCRKLLKLFERASVSLLPRSEQVKHLNISVINVLCQVDIKRKLLSRNVHEEPINRYKASGGMSSGFREQVKWMFLRYIPLPLSLRKSKATPCCRMMCSWSQVNVAYHLVYYYLLSPPHLSCYRSKEKKQLRKSVFAIKVFTSSK